MVAGDAGQPAHALQQVGKMAQQVLVGLGGGVGHVGEQPEGRHVGKGPSRRLPHVDGPGRARPRRLRQLGQGAGQLQGAGEVVGGARRDVAQHRTLVRGQGQQALNRLVQGAVPSAAHHPVEPAAVLQDGAGGVPPPLGGVDGDLIALPGKDLHHVGQAGLGRPAPCGGVIDVQ